MLSAAPDVAEIELSPLARADLAEIDECSADQYGQDVADAYLRGFNEAFALLARHPFSGPPRTDLGDGIRCLVHRKHRIFYRLEQNGITIVRIIHHARNARNMLL